MSGDLRSSHMEALVALGDGEKRPCPVCDDEMGMEVKALSYGGLCCLSCRAFFRRAHQETKSPKLFCRSGGRCPVTPVTRRRCASCRMDACIKVGMRSALVLTQEQKEKRFRRVRAKKGQISIVKKEEDFLRQIHKVVKDEEDFNSDEVIKSALEAAKAEQIAVGKVENERQDAMFEASHRMQINGWNSQQVPLPVIAKETTQNPRQLSWDESLETFEQSKFKCGSCFSAGKMDAKTILLKALGGVIDEFNAKAAELKPKVFEESDWRSLSRHNKRLYLNFVLGQFLTAKLFVEKISWLSTSGKNNCQLCISRLATFADVNIFVNEQLGLFAGDKLMQGVYLGFAKSLSDLNLEPNLKGKMMELLFFYQGGLELENPGNVLVNFAGALKALEERCAYNFLLQDINSVGRTLESMSLLFDHSGLAGLLSGYSQDSNPSLLPIGFTAEESLWLEKQKDGVIGVMASVTTGPDLIAQLLDYAAGGRELTAAWAYGAGLVNKERFWRLFRLHESFTTLSDQSQLTVVSSTLHLFTSLVSCLTDGMDIRELAELGIPKRQMVGQNANAGVILHSPSNQSRPLRPVKIRSILPHLPPDFEGCLHRVQHFVRLRQDGYLSFFAILIRILFDPIVVAHKNNSCGKIGRFGGLEATGKQFQALLSRKFGADWDEFERECSEALLDLHILGTMLPSP